MRKTPVHRIDARAAILGLWLLVGVVACNPAEGAKAPSNGSVAPGAAQPASSAGAIAVAPAASVSLQTPEAAPAAQSAAASAAAEPASPASPASAAAAAAPPAARSPVVQASTGLPAGAGRDTVQRVCGACHSIETVTAVGRSPQGWADVIGQMQNMGLSASDEELETVHAYLSKNLPPK